MTAPEALLAAMLQRKAASSTGAHTYACTWNIMLMFKVVDSVMKAVGAKSVLHFQLQADRHTRMAVTGCLYCLDSPRALSYLSFRLQS